MNIRCLIVDDEPLAQKVIETHIKKLEGWELAGKCRTAMEAFEVLHTGKIDVIFLDIQMPVITGLDFLRSLRNPPIVVFTTANPGHALEGFELNATDYLLKPVSFERFLKAIEKVNEKLSKPASGPVVNANPVDYLFVKADNRLIRVDYHDIDYIECEKDYAKVFTKDKMIVTHQTMKRFEEELPTDKFIRVHRSYIVSLKAIRSIYGNTVETAKGQIPIGVNYKDEVMKMVTGK